jgi:light-regulated signal transduction histidine kinase (bacteriophytochrome)
MSPQPEMNRRELIAAQALLSELNELSSRAGHDLLGPLNQAGSLLPLFIKRYRNQLDSEADKLLEFLQSASTRMEVVVAGVRKYMEIASRAPSFGPVDLNASLASSLTRLEKAISESGAVILSDRLPRVSADAAHMATVFEILIGNAIKFRKPDAPPRVQVYSMRGVISIADNGIGIEPEQSEAVFLPFKRLNGAEYSGAGLGLATAKLIIGMHGGSIRIEADPRNDSGGTQVQFTVPA